MYELILFICFWGFIFGCFKDKETERCERKAPIKSKIEAKLDKIGDNGNLWFYLILTIGVITLLIIFFCAPANENEIKKEIKCTPTTKLDYRPIGV